MENALGEPQTIVVLGGASDLGQAIARALAGPTVHTIVLAARDPDAAVAGYGDAGSARVVGARFDATESGSHEELLAALAAEHGDLDVVVLAFGVLGAEDVEFDVRAAADLARVNYVGVVSCGLAAAELVRTQGHGTIVVLSSVAGVRVRRSNFVYGSSKAGADAFAVGLADALEGSGGNVVVVRPGFVRTAMTVGRDPAPFATDAATVGAAVATAVREGARVVWVPGVLRYVMTVLRHAPRFVWRRLDR